MMPRRAQYDIVDVGERLVFIEDLNGPVSVTNDAENVVKEINLEYPNHRIIYRDSDGRWDELRHEDGVFNGFRTLELER